MHSYLCLTYPMLDKEKIEGVYQIGLLTLKHNKHVKLYIKISILGIYLFLFNFLAMYLTK